MSECFEINSALGRYEVFIRSGALAERMASGDVAAVICDARFNDDLVAAIGDKVVPVEATEQNKTIIKCAEVIGLLRDKGVGRRDRLAAVGGGIVQDVATFTASVYMRGLEWVYFPTTLLAMVDSCIGGKSAINVAGYKNIAGNFHPPQQVYIDPAFAMTLGAGQFAGGLLEAVKICFARGDEALDAFLAAAGQAATDEAALRQVILTSLKSKKWFIEVDEFDQNERLLLNFGHTFGHALEAATHFGVNHGVAVGVGMMAAVAFARRQGLLNAAGEARVARLYNYTRGMVKQVPDLGAVLTAMNIDEFLKAFISDKKHLSDRYVLILPNADGYLERPSFPRTSATEALTIQAFKDAVQEIVS
jgi:3-dehydroquinate synthase